MVRTFIAACAIALTGLCWVRPVEAVNWSLVNFGYDGGGVEEGIEDANAFNTGGTTDVRETITNILFGIILFLGIIAVLMIVIAGVILIVAGSDEGQRDKARKMVLYAVVGLIVITLAGAFVMWIDNTFAGG